MRTFRRATPLFCAALTFLASCGTSLEGDADPALTPPLQPDAAVTPSLATDAGAAPPASMALDGSARSTPAPSAVDAAHPVLPVDSDAALSASDASASDAALSAADGGAVTANCQGKPGMRRGKSNQTLMAGGARRSFVYYAPKNLDPNKPVPLVIIPHGTNMSGQGMYDITRYAALADREGVVAIFPDGASGPGSLVPWNVGSGVCGLGAVVAGSSNDQPFVDELIKFAEQDQCIDTRHIFMTGFSMGGYFSHETACVGSKLAAIGPHSGGTHDLSRCQGKRLPVIMFHFTSDSLIDYACGAEARDHWVDRNGCTKTGPDVVPVKGGKCEYYKNCMPSAQVAFCSFDPPSFSDDGLPSGHGWSGGAKEGGESFAAISNSESATELGWTFFKKYAW
jgi:poly(3-hydroxybutyrate) depolymerase